MGALNERRLSDFKGRYAELQVTQSCRSALLLLLLLGEVGCGLTLDVDAEHAGGSALER